MGFSRRVWLSAAVAAPAVGAAGVYAFSQQSRREPQEVHEELTEGRRIIVSNGVPSHATGDFPNRHDPVPLRAQAHRFEVALKPKVAERPTELRFWEFGVAVNGVPFDPSGPFWNADGDSGWQFEVMAPASAVALGIDVNHAHTQGRGMYHYHGLPTGLLWELRHQDPTRVMLLLGYAADGFPIYGPEAPGAADDPASPTKRLRASYRLKDGKRKDGPGGRHDGMFVEDYEYVPGWGDLDECNGRTGPTPEYPDGIYHYMLTDEFPYIPRLYRGKPDPSFKHGPPPGVSPPVPRELMGYKSIG